MCSLTIYLAMHLSPMHLSISHASIYLHAQDHPFCMAHPVCRCALSLYIHPYTPILSLSLYMHPYRSIYLLSLPIYLSPINLFISVPSNIPVAWLTLFADEYCLSMYIPIYQYLDEPCLSMYIPIYQYPSQ